MRVRVKVKVKVKVKVPVGSTDQSEEVLPEVLGHQPEEGEEGPAERVVAGVAVVGVLSRLHAAEALRTLAVETPHSYSP